MKSVYKYIASLRNCDQFIKNRDFLRIFIPDMDSWSVIKIGPRGMNPSNSNAAILHCKILLIKYYSQPIDAWVITNIPYIIYAMY